MARKTKNVNEIHTTHNDNDCELCAHLKMRLMHSGYRTRKISDSYWTCEAWKVKNAF